MTVLLIAADITIPESTTNPVVAQPSASAAPVASAGPVASANPVGNAPAPASSTANPAGFNAVDDSTQMQSGEALLIEAYIAIWVLLFGFIVAAWLRTRRVEDKVIELEKAIERAKAAAPIPTTRRSASEPPAEPEKA